VFTITIITNIYENLHGYYMTPCRKMAVA